MIYNKIKITCPDCKKSITVRIKSIDLLQSENKSLRKKVSDLTAELRALEVLTEKQNNQDIIKDFQGMFG